MSPKGANSVNFTTFKWYFVQICAIICNTWSGERYFEKRPHGAQNNRVERYVKKIVFGHTLGLTEYERQISPRIVYSPHDGAMTNKKVAILNSVIMNSY